MSFTPCSPQHTNNLPAATAAAMDHDTHAPATRPSSPNSYPDTEVRALVNTVYQSLCTHIQDDTNLARVIWPQEVTPAHTSQPSDRHSHLPKPNLCLTTPHPEISKHQTALTKSWVYLLQKTYEEMKETSPHLFTTNPQTLAEAHPLLSTISQADQLAKQVFFCLADASGPAASQTERCEDILFGIATPAFSNLCLAFLKQEGAAPATCSPFNAPLAQTLTFTPLEKAEGDRPATRMTFLSLDEDDRDDDNLQKSSSEADTPPAPPPLNYKPYLRHVQTAQQQFDLHRANANRKDAQKNLSPTAPAFGKTIHLSFSDSESDNDDTSANSSAEPSLEGRAQVTFATMATKAAKIAGAKAAQQQQLLHTQAQVLRDLLQWISDKMPPYEQGKLSWPQELHYYHQEPLNLTVDAPHSIAQIDTIFNAWRARVTKAGKAINNSAIISDSRYVNLMEAIHYRTPQQIPPPPIEGLPVQSHLYIQNKILRTILGFPEFCKLVAQDLEKNKEFTSRHDFTAPSHFMGRLDRFVTNVKK